MCRAYEADPVGRGLNTITKVAEEDEVFPSSLVDYLIGKLQCQYNGQVDSEEATNANEDPLVDASPWRMADTGVRLDARVGACWLWVGAVLIERPL